MSKTDHNGWANYETWNWHLWLTGKSEWTYAVAVQMVREGRSPKAIAIVMIGKSTPDGVSVEDPAIDWDEIASALKEL